MKNAYMQTYDEKGVPDANVYMTRSVLDLDTRIVTSDIPVTVQPVGFRDHRPKRWFSTPRPTSGHMTGHVRMTIYNRQEHGPSETSPGRSPGPSPAATPNDEEAPFSRPTFLASPLSGVPARVGPNNLQRRSPGRAAH